MSFNYDSSLSLSGEIDAATGLYYFNARWYDAGTGRFISEDPARDGQNWYIYTTNNPLKYIDPTGMRRVVDEDENGDLTLENPNSDLVGRSHGDDRNDGGNEPPKKDEPETKTLWGKFVENAQNAYRKDKLKETLSKLPNEVVEQLAELGVFEDDFSGVIYAGVGMSASALLGVGNESGMAFAFENGSLVASEEYQSVSLGFILDIGASTYGVIGVLPGGTMDNFFGVGGSGGIGYSKPSAGLETGTGANITTPNDILEGKEIYRSLGKSVVPYVDINADSITITQRNNTQASSYYIPPRKY